METKTENEPKELQFEKAKGSVIERLFESVLVDIIDTISTYRVSLLSQTDLLSELKKHYQNLRILSEGGVIRESLKHAELSLINCLESDLLKENVEVSV